MLNLQPRDWPQDGSSGLFLTVSFPGGSHPSSVGRSRGTAGREESHNQTVLSYYLLTYIFFLSVSEGSWKKGEVESRVWAR